MRIKLHRFIGWFYVANGVLFWLLGYPYLQKIWLSDTLFQNTLFDYSGVGGHILIGLFTVLNYFSYMTLLALMPAFFLWVMAYLYPRQRLIMGLSIGVASLSLLLLLMDVYIFLTFNFHLNTTIFSMLFDIQMRNILGFSQYEMGLFWIGIAVLITLESVIAWIVWSRIVLPGRVLYGKRLAKLWLMISCLCYFTFMTALSKNINIFAQQTINLPLFNQLLAYTIPVDHARLKLNQMGEDHFALRHFSADAMQYPLHPMECQLKTAPPYNVILIMVDTLRHDAIDDSFMPHVNQFAQQSWQFMRHISGGNATQPGLFSLFYAIPASYWTAALTHQIGPVFLDVLLQQGYTTAVFWSIGFDIPAFDKTIYAHLSHEALHQSRAQGVGGKDRDVTQQAIDFLNHHVKTQPFFLNLFYDAAHSYCSDQDFEPLDNSQHAGCMRFFMGKQDENGVLLSRYHNALHFIDGEIQRVLVAIQQAGYWDNSVIIITSDHGEEFNDNHHRYWGHAGNFSEAQTHIPLLIHWPGTAARQVRYQTTSYDVMPTLLTHLFFCQNPISDYSIGQDLLLEKGRAPFILAGSYSNMGLIEPDRLTTLYASGDIVMTTPHLDRYQEDTPEEHYLSQAMTLMRMYYLKPKKSN